MLTAPLLKTNQSNSTPTEVQIKLAIAQVLSLPSVYNSPVFILDFKIDDKEVVTGRFRDARKPRVFSYEIADDGITFKPFVPGRMDGFDVKFWEDFSAGYSYRIDAVAKKRTEKPKCKEGVSYPCGKSCISLKKNCKTNPQDPVSKARRQKLKNTVEEVQKAKGGVAASGGAGVSKEAEEVAIKVGAKQVNIVGSPDLYKELNLTHDPSLGWQVTNKNGDVLRQPKNGNLQPSHRFKEKSQAENFAKQVIAKVSKLPSSKPQEQVKPTPDKMLSGKTLDLGNLWQQTASAAYSKNKEAVSKHLEEWKQVVKKLESGEGISKDINLNEYEKLMDNLERRLVFDPKDPSNIEFKKITGSIYRTLDKAVRVDPLTREDLEKAHPNFRPIMQRMKKTFDKSYELRDKKQLVEKELNSLKQEKSYNEAVILNNSKQFRETGIDNNYNELKTLVKRNPNDFVEIKNPVSNLPERKVSVPDRIDEVNKNIRDLADDGKALELSDQARKKIAQLQPQIKDIEGKVSSFDNEIKLLRESREKTDRSSSSQNDLGLQVKDKSTAKPTEVKTEKQSTKWNNKNFSPDDYIKEKDSLADEWFKQGNKDAKEKYDQWVQNSLKKKVRLTVPGDVLATPDFVNMQRSGMINKNEIESKVKTGKELETLRTSYTFPSSFGHALQLYESQKPGVRKKIKFEFDGDLPEIPGTNI